MMNFHDLIKQGSLRRDLRVNFSQIEGLLIRAKKDLDLADKIIGLDEATALELVYKSMFHSANALLRSYGYRPGRISQHIGVIEATKLILGENIEPLIGKFNQLRKKRNKLEYEGVYLGTRTEINNGLTDAKAFIEKVALHIETKNPQKRLNI